MHFNRFTIIFNTKNVANMSIFVSLHPNLEPDPGFGSDQKGPDIDMKHCREYSTYMRTDYTVYG
jgi:hypothetical protein